MIVELYDKKETIVKHMPKEVQIHRTIDDPEE